MGAPKESRPKGGRAERSTAARGRGWTGPRDGSDRPQDRVRPRVRALVRLLDDESSAVVDAVRSELCAIGRPALGALRRAAESSDARLRTRARAIAATVERREVVRRLARRAAQPHADLEGSLFLLGHLDRPQLDARPYRRALDAMAEVVRERMGTSARGLPRSLSLVTYLAGDLGYAGSQEDYGHPDNVHFHRVIERKRGMPLTLVALYLSVARRAGIHGAAVALPGHVMLRLYSDDGRSVLVDPFHRGHVRTRKECDEYLTQHGLAPDPAWYRDAGEGQLLHRHINNLHNSLRARGLAGRAAELRRALVAGSSRRKTGPA